MLHTLKGSAFHTENKDIQKLTLWEQIDEEMAYTPTKKFLTVIPILLYVLDQEVKEREKKGM